MMLTLNFDSISEMYNSSNDFPVSFNDTWEWLEYSRFDAALRAFLKLDFVENVDYLVFHISVENSEGRPSKDYFLSCDCFKHFSMMSKSEGGKKVRNYFIQCEKIAKEAYKKSSNLENKLKIQSEIENKFKELEQVKWELQQFKRQESFVYSLVAANYQELEPKVISQTPQPITSENDLNSSLVANRLGLAFNKHLKTFEKLQSSTSPEAFGRLKDSYMKLASEYQELVVAKSQVEVVEKIVEIPVVLPEMQETIEQLIKDKDYLHRVISNLENELQAKRNKNEMKTLPEKKRKSSKRNNSALTLNTLLT